MVDMLNGANTVFLIVSSILVFCMTPGLAFFYGGLVSRKNVVNTMLSVFIICAAAVLGLRYFGELKKATLTLAWATAHRNGYAACHGGEKAFHFKDKDDKVFAFYGLSGSGKSTLLTQSITASSILLFCMTMRS